jgi:hypothetical protein
MEIIPNRYGNDRVYTKIDATHIRIMGESLISRGSEDENGNQTMYDFEGGPCLNVGGTLKFMGSDFKIKSIKSEQSNQENIASVMVEVEI